MSETLYTCDYCIENGHDEVACHRDYELLIYGDKVVCEGCVECGEFPELDDIEPREFISPDKVRIAWLEKLLRSARSVITNALIGRDIDTALRNSQR